MSWPPLTDDQARVLHVVERQCRFGDPVPTKDVAELARHRVDSLLRSLEAKGYIVRAARGFWLPSPGWEATR